MENEQFIWPQVNQNENLPEPKPISYGASEDDLKGRFANSFQISANDNSVCVDFFATAAPNQKVQHNLVSRIFLTHKSAKLLSALIASLEKQVEEKNKKGPLPLPPHNNNQS